MPSNRRATWSAIVARTRNSLTQNLDHPTAEHIETFATTESSNGGPQRLMFVVHRLAHGGAELQVAALATRLVDRGREVSVVVPSGADQQLADRMRAEGVRVVDLGTERLGQTVLRLAAEIRRWKPDIVHAHAFRPNIAARLARPLARGFTLICTTHNLGESEYPFNTRQWQLRYRATDPMSSLTTNVCRAGLERYVAARAIPRSKGGVVPNGIDVQQFRPDDAARVRVRAELALGDSPTLIAVGRITEGKGYETLLEAFSGMVDKSRAVLLLVGSGSIERSLQDQAASLGLGDHVRFLGARDDVAELLNAADGYVMASWSEAFPLVLLEASAVGLPIVATSVGGNGDIVASGGTGLLVPPQDINALREAMETILRMSSADRRAMGAAGRARTVDQFSLDRVVDRWEQIYGELVERGGWWSRRGDQGL